MPIQRTLKRTASKSSQNPQSQNPAKRPRFQWWSRPQKSLAQKVLAIVRKDEVAHHCFFSEIAKITVQDIPYTSSCFTEIAQGTNNYQRLGDEIYVEAIKVRLALDSSATTTPTLFRFMVVKSGIEIGAGTSGAWQSGGTGLAMGQLFVNTGVVDGANQGIVDPKKLTVLHDITHTITPNVATQVVHDNLQFTVPCKFKHVYNPSNSGYAKMKQIYFVVIAHQFGATSGVTTVGTVTMSCDIIFKNEA